MEFIDFDNGLRVALEYREDAMSAAVDIYVGSGSVCESDDIAGTAHFIEHMVFKGSRNYSSRDIARLTDTFGGNINAYTTKEYTCFYARALTEHFPKMLDILTDMVTAPTFDADAVETEKGVVIEEIGMYEDSPEDLGYDLLGGAVWKGSRLAHIILGTRQSVSSITPDSLFRYSEKFYAPERTVISVCGKFDRDGVLEAIEKKFGVRKNGGLPVAAEEAEFCVGSVLHRKKTEQTCVYLAFPGIAVGDPRRHAVAIFSEITGGGSASRMNMRIREELGLAYSTYAYSSSYLGCGDFGIFAALNAKSQRPFLEESLKILNGMKDFCDEDELYRVKQQFKSGMIMNSESLQGIAAGVGKQLLLRNCYTDIAETARQIEAVTAEDVRSAARLLFDVRHCTLCVVGAPEKESFYRDILKKYE